MPYTAVLESTSLCMATFYVMCLNGCTYVTFHMAASGFSVICLYECLA